MNAACCAWIARWVGLPERYSPLLAPAPMVTGTMLENPAFGMVTRVVTVLVLLFGLVSGVVVVTVLVLTRVPAAVPTLTVTQMTLLAPDARLARVAVSTPPATLIAQPSPEALTTVTPGGSVSVT